jgi:hypothetical protein
MSKIQIALSEAPPVQITRADWPVIATDSWFSGQHECQANETAWIKVREHSDGRRIVYGIRDKGPGGMPLGYVSSYAGYLLPANGENGESDTIRAIRRVAGVLALQNLAASVIAELPARVLT